MKRCCSKIILMCILAVFSVGSISFVGVAGHTGETFSHCSDAGCNATPKNIGNEVFYQLVIDRFENGNRSNDCSAMQGRYCSIDHSNWYKYWGGDLRGVINRLDYLKNLGVTRVWLTPIFENQQVEVPRNKYGQDVLVSSYHGYWIKDWYRLNQVFTDGGTRDYRILDELIQKASPQIKFYLDTVANHTGPWDATAESLWRLQQEEPIPPAGDGMPRTHKGAYFRDGNYVMGLEEDGMRADRGSWGPFFHHHGSIVNWNSQTEVQDYSLDGLSDLAQENGFVSQYLSEAHKFWLDRFPGLGGYRVDTIKNVPNWYWRMFSDDVLARHPNQGAIGEYFASGQDEVTSVDFYRTTRFSMFDFQLRSTLMSVFKNHNSFRELTDLWARDGIYGDARALVTFIDNHDVPRMRGMGMSYQEMKMAMATLFAARGIPCLLYGMEQDLFHPNDPGDPYNRPMMRNFDQNSDLYRWISRLAAVRQENPALRFGNTHIIHESDNILGFERINGSDMALFVVSKNGRQGADAFRISGLRFPDGEYIDKLSGARHTVRQGGIDVQLHYGDVILLSTR